MFALQTQGITKQMVSDFNAKQPTFWHKKGQLEKRYEESWYDGRAKRMLGTM